MVELLVVVAIAMIASVMTMPLIMTSVNQYRLRTTTVDLDALLQRARSRAVRDNRTYPVQSTTFGQGGLTYTQVFLDSVTQNGTLDAGEPVIQLQKNVSLVTAGVPAIPVATLGFTPQPVGTQVSFNGRGTPCLVLVAGGPCGSWDSAGATPNPVGFVYYLRARGTNTAWSAVSISPTGRFRAWNYDTKSTTWSY